MESDRILVPFRAIYEALGAKAEWDSSTQTAMATMGNKSIVTQVDNPQITVNGKTTPLDVPSRLIGGCVFVPIRAISEGLGAQVDWDDGIREVSIIYQPYQ